MRLTSCRSKEAPRLLLIASPNSYRTVPYLEAARRRGIDVLVASEGRFSLVSAVAEGLHVNLAEPAALDQLQAAAALRPFAGVVATDDACVELASRIARALQLPHNPPESARFTRRKDLSRHALAAAGVCTPAFRTIDLQQPLAPQLEGLEYPCVVKPLALSASRGVIRVDDEGTLHTACARVERILAGESGQEGFTSTHLLVEAFVPGVEVALEGLLRRGRLNVLAIFDKPDPLDGPYFEETYYITPSRHDEGLKARIVACVADACQALGLREGPVHAELRISEGDGIILEVASRTIGGDCGRLLRFGTGQTLEDLVISHAVDHPLSMDPQQGAAGVLMVPVAEGGILRRVEGITQARAVPWIEDVVIAVREGYELVPLPEGATYLGFIFARAPTPDAAEAALREAHAKLKVVVAPVMRLEDGRRI